VLQAEEQLDVPGGGREKSKYQNEVEGNTKTSHNELQSCRTRETKSQQCMRRDFRVLHVRAITFLPLLNVLHKVGRVRKGVSALLKKAVS
jgi:hypothetical protein